MVDAAQAGQEEQGGAIVGSGVVNFLAAFFGIDRNGLEPFRQAFAHVFLKKSLALNSVGIATQHQSAIAQERAECSRPSDSSRLGDLAWCSRSSGK